MTSSPLTVAELINTYRVTNLTERRREDPRHARWWVEHLGTLPVSDLTTARILQALNRVRAEGRTGARAGSTVAFYLRFLRCVTTWGTCVTMLPTDPCVGIPLPKEPTPPMRVLPEEEEPQLCQALGRPYSLWVRLAVLTGMEPVRTIQSLVATGADGAGHRDAAPRHERGDGGIVTAP